MKTLILILILLVVSACSNKEKVTTSKIKISGAGVFSSSFGTTASNGMILYGKSSDGKNFTKILDAETTDLEFPNGTWSFFAVAWDQTGAGTNNNFKGTKKCGSSEGVNLNGTDVTINLSVSVNGCANFAFYQPRITTCKNNSLVTSDSISLCSQANSNKGYGTWMRVAVPEYKNFTQGNIQISSNALRTYCISVSSSTSDGAEATSESSNLSTISIPKDVFTTAEVFYSQAACDGTYGVDTFIVGGPKVKFFDSGTTRRLYVESHEGDVCKNERLTKVFASGIGTASHPYTICNKAQWNNIGANFGTYNSSSFELLANIDFGMGSVNMIGEQVGSAMTGFSGNVNGNNHTVSNGMLTCPTSATSESGIFRLIDGTSTSNKIKDITFNTILNFCGFTNYTGGVAGRMVNGQLNNVKYFGALEGQNYVGGLVGKVEVSLATNQNFITNSHVNAHVNGYQFIGGLVGYAYRSSGTIDLLLDKVSFKGQVSAHGSGGTPYLTYAGGIVGKFDGTGSTTAKVREAVVLADVIEGSQIIGGIIGEAVQASVEDSYVRTTFKPNTTTNNANQVMLGGIIGSSSSTVNILRSFNMMSYVNPYTDGSDFTFGGLVGAGSATCTNAYWIGNAAYSHGSNGVTSCNTSTMTIPSSKTISSYNGYSASTYWATSTDGDDYPRLAWESALENKIPYLKRECVGASMFLTNPVGSGTLLDPYLICTVDQFQGMTAGNVYVLKRDLNFNGTVFTPRPLGKYTLLGNNKTIQDFIISPNANDSAGIFRSLSVGSLVKNLKIKGASVYSTGLTGVIASISGVVAGINNGDITNVAIDISKVGLQSTLSYNASGSPQIVLGAVAGINGANGKISGDISANVGVYDLETASNSSGELYLGGIVGKNNGVVTGVKSHSQVKFYSTAAANDMNNKVFIGGAAGLNNNILEQLEIDGSIYITNSTAYSLGYAGPIVGVNAGSVGIIRDIVARSGIISSGTYAPAAASYTLIPIQEAGSVAKRIIFEPQGDGIPSSTVLMSNVSDSVCIMGSPLTGCYSSSFITYNADAIFGLHVKDNGTSILDVANWNVTYGMSMDSNRVWRLPDASSDTDWVTKRPEIISASGSIEKIGQPY